MNSESHDILIGTPAYAGMVHLDYLQSVTGYIAAGIRVTIAGVGNESLITRARNGILSRFHRSPNHTHLLFLDGDVHLPAAGLLRLLSHEVDVVGAAVPLKGFNSLGERMFNVGPSVGEWGCMHEVQRIGTAALLLSRRAVNALVEDARQDGRVYPAPFQRQVRGGPPDLDYDVFQVGVVGGEYLSEDYWVCQRLRRLGFRVYVDPEIATRHQGITQF